MSYPRSVQKLIELLSQFPTIGERTAARLIFFLLKKPKKETQDLIQALSDLQKVKQCPSCFNFFEPEKDKELCNICSDSKRNQKVLCVVEKEPDLLSIERMGRYKGLYFIIGGTLSSFNKKKKRIRDKELKKKIKDNSEIKEIIIALNPTTEGKATITYLEKELKPFKRKITKLAKGLPAGGELEYADEETLLSAFKGRN